MNNSNPEITEPKPPAPAKVAESKPPKAEKKKAPEENKPFVLKPKKPTSPWIYFNNEKVAALKKEKGMDQKEAFTQSAAIWKGLSEEEKKPF